jgi:ATP-binding cassette subfamily B protein
METPAEEDSPEAIDVDRFEGSVDFVDVTFGYDERTVLDSVNISIPKGQTYAFVGASGGGKTTLCHLIPKFYNVEHGDILIDGTSIKNITSRSLRQNVGIVQQDVFLFTGTFRENIAYGDINATEEQIVEAAKRANIHDYIMSLEKGYDTEIGERGIKLSGGQKQRLSIARVFLKNPSILILDEATSALDNATETLIQNALSELCVGRTTIVVAHRLSTVRNADKIIVINKGKIEEEGTHDELVALDGIYRKLHDAQYKDGNVNGLIDCN